MPEARGYRSAASNAVYFMNVHHECNGRSCRQPINVNVRRPLGCGCTRWEGDRHDGTRIHLLSGGCALHVPDAEVGPFNP